jgi:hypothetical protein
MKFHFNVATEGLRSNHKYISVLGLKWLQVEIIPPKFEEPAGGGTGVGNKYYTIRITIKLNGKTIKREYTNLIVDEVIRITMMIKESFTSVFASIKQLTTMNKYINSSIKSKTIVDPSITVSVKDNIKIKVKVNGKN